MYKIQTIYFRQARHLYIDQYFEICKNSKLLFHFSSENRANSTKKTFSLLYINPVINLSCQNYINFIETLVLKVTHTRNITLIPRKTESLVFLVYSIIILYS